MPSSIRLAVFLVVLSVLSASCTSGPGGVDTGTSTTSIVSTATPTTTAPTVSTPEMSTPEMSTTSSKEDAITSSLDRTPLFDPYEDPVEWDVATGSGVQSADFAHEVFLVDSGTTDLDPTVASMTEAFATEWNRRAADLSSLRVGLPQPDPRDLIPPIDRPLFETVTQGGYWLGQDEPGAMVRIGEEARFYPLSILTRHEVINDRFGDTPIAVTYCPLCNSAASFDRRVDGAVLRFGVSGLLRESDLVMWDDVTESLWQQITGTAIVGNLAGTHLASIPTAIVSFGQFARDFPDGRSLSTRTGFAIKYGANPYRFYSSSQGPFAGFFDGEVDDRLPAMERVVGVTVEDQSSAVPFGRLAKERVVHMEVAGRPVVVFWGGDTADALDAPDVAAGTAIGTAVAWSARVDGTDLSFTPVGVDQFRDDQTGSTWTILGRALDGPLAGSALDAVIHRNDFWFAWASFFPDANLETS